MPTIAPTITAETAEDYSTQIDKIKSFALRIHIDFSDGQFAPRRLLSPEQAWWPAGIRADFHLMYSDPTTIINSVLDHHPDLVIVQAEGHGDFISMAQHLKQTNVKVGVALLEKTSVDQVAPALNLIDHILIFSGNLGYQGGSYANLSLLEKVSQLKKIKPELEVGWDGGINSQNVSQLVSGGVDVLNVGGFIQSAKDPGNVFHSLQRIADETGTT